MSGRYATNTSVSVEKSRGELERILQRYGATGFGYVTQGSRVAIQFQVWQDDERPRNVRMLMEMPDPDSREFTHTEAKNLRRSNEQQQALWEKACRSRWRALNLVVKAKPEAIEAGISTFDQEFLAHMLTGDGRTVYEHVQDQLPSLDAGGSMLMLPGASA
jgi:hypothetical protein